MESGTPWLITNICAPNNSSCPTNWSGNNMFFNGPNDLKTKYEVLTLIIDYCNTIGLNILLSHHGIEGVNGQWYTNNNDFTELEYLKTLFYLAENLTQDNIIGIDLINEPHLAKWDDSGDKDNLKRFVQIAGKNIRALRPDWLIFAEGIWWPYLQALIDQEENLPITPLAQGNIYEQYGGVAENLRNVSLFSVNNMDIPDHKIVFSPHTNLWQHDFIEFDYIDRYYTDQDYTYDTLLRDVKVINDFRWGYLATDFAVMPGEFSAVFADPLYSYSADYTGAFVRYMAETKLPGSFYWSINGNDFYGSAGDGKGLYDYDPNNSNHWTTIKTDGKIDTLRVLYGTIEKTFSSSEGKVYSPRDGTRYNFPTGSLTSGDVVAHTAHWAGEGDGTQYAYDVIAAKANIGELHSILHEFKVTCEDQYGTPIGTASNDFTISIEYTDEELGNVDETSLSFYKYTGGQWIISNATDVTHTASTNEIELETDEFGIYAVLGTRVLSQRIELPLGWSLISSYINPDLPDMDDIFTNCTACDYNSNPLGCELIIVKNGAGQVYWPFYNTNAIGSWDYRQGYQVKMNNSSSIVVHGIQVDNEDTPIDIPVGWSIIGYLNTTPQNIVTMLSNIVGTSPYYNIDIVKDGAGLVYWPQYSGLNEIGNMKPGEGYQIKMLAPKTNFFFPEPVPGSKSRQQDKMFSNLVFKNFAQDIYINTDNNMVVGIPYASWETAPVQGDEIAAIGENGQLVGKTIFTGGFTAITIYGDDYYTTNIIENLSDNESFSFEIWSASNKSTKSYKFKKWEKGEGTFSKNGIAVVGTDKIEESQPVFKMELYPNPGQGKFVLNILTSANFAATIKVYDIGGKIVFYEELSVNEGSQKRWLDLSTLEVGIYTLVLDGDNANMQTKLVIIK